MVELESIDIENLLYKYKFHRGKLFAWGGVFSSFSVKDGKACLEIQKKRSVQFSARFLAVKLMRSYQTYHPFFQQFDTWEVSVRLRVGDWKDITVLEAAFLYRNEALKGTRIYFPHPNTLNLELSRRGHSDKYPRIILRDIPCFIFEEAHLHPRLPTSRKPFYVESACLGSLCLLDMEALVVYSAFSLKFDGGIGAVYPGLKGGQGNLAYWSQAKRFLLVPNEEVNRIRERDEWSITREKASS